MGQTQQMGQTNNSNWNHKDPAWGTGYFNQSQSQSLRKTGFDKFKRTENQRMVSIMPFIEEYFAPVNLKETFSFRSMCLQMNSGQSSPIFDNENVEVRLISTPRAYIVSVKNKTSY